MKKNRGIHTAQGTVYFTVLGKAGKLVVMPGTSIFPKMDLESKPHPDLESPRTLCVSHMVLSKLTANPGPHVQKYCYMFLVDSNLHLQAAGVWVPYLVRAAC